MRQRRLEFVGRSQRDLGAFPEDVQEDMVFALLQAQVGQKHVDAKVLFGFGGANVLEIAVAFMGDAYRVVSTIRFTSGVYVLHAFKKKSTKGIETPKRDIALIHSRRKDAGRLHTQRRTP